MGRLEVLPSGRGRQQYEAASQCSYLCADIEWNLFKGLKQRKSLETLVSKRVFGFFLLVQKETAATRSGAFVPATAVCEAKAQKQVMPMGVLSQLPVAPHPNLRYNKMSDKELHR